MAQMILLKMGKGNTWTRSGLRGCLALAGIGKRRNEGSFPVEDLSRLLASAYDAISKLLY
jgi:hypothetical protein